jgi:hypothetical protein
MFEVPMRCVWCGGNRIAAIVAAVAICGVAMEAVSAEPGAPSGIECRIDVSKTDGLLKLQAIGRSRTPATGRYQFAVSKNNAAGSTANAQSGGFALTPDEDRVLTTVMLESAAEGHFSAQLLLKSSAGNVSCKSP